MNAGYLLASTLVTTPKSSEVHSNVASHRLLLPLDDVKAGCSLPVRVTNRFYISTVEVLRLSESVKMSDRHPLGLTLAIG